MFLCSKRSIAETRWSPIRYRVDRIRSPETPSKIIIGGGSEIKRGWNFRATKGGTIRQRLHISCTVLRQPDSRNGNGPHPLRKGAAGITAGLKARKKVRRNQALNIVDNKIAQAPYRRSITDCAVYVLVYAIAGCISFIKVFAKVSWKNWNNF